MCSVHKNLIFFLLEALCFFFIPHLFPFPQSSFSIFILLLHHSKLPIRLKLPLNPATWQTILPLHPLPRRIPPFLLPRQSFLFGD
ncbi:hypothetical protein F4809DRAFT_627312 [Biscogniauxia mediterranea]|nr:hypothetical protein F4809DRAFT_627312 [Biscogniauxia mediterranea]